MKKRLVLVALAVALVLVAGCGGVWMNARYSELLDRTAAVSAETADRAESGKLDCEQAKLALRAQAEVWSLFKKARDGAE